MNELPLPVRTALRRLSRRLAIGLFVDIWPAWAIGTILAAGGVAVVARLFIPPMAAHLSWLWLAPIVAAIPAVALGVRRAYQPAQVLALADSLAGGNGLLLSLVERPHAAWTDSDALRRIAELPLPSLHPWRPLRLIPLALAFLAVALAVPQRVAGGGSQAVASQVVAGAVSSVEAMKKDQLIRREEEKKLEQEIEQIRRSAAGRVDAGAWEAGDAMQQRMAASLAAKQDAVQWAQESLARYAAAAQAGAGDSKGGASSAASDAEELAKALQRLAESGLLNGAPQELSALAAGRGLPGDPQALAKLQAALGTFLSDKAGRLADAASIAKGGRFDPSEFGAGHDASGERSNQPGRGGVDRGRGDADLTLGPETKRFDRFKAQALPPGAVRSPDDWAPIAVLPGAPSAVSAISTSAAARAYAAGAGQEAWRRTLAPRHQSAVKKYFETSQ
jgi:hypothetical protein